MQNSILRRLHISWNLIKTSYLGRHLIIMVFLSQPSSTLRTINMTIFSDNVTTSWSNDSSGNSTEGICVDWLDAQHALFQLANLCMVISFLTPSNFRHHSFFLRLMLNFGFLFIVIWSSLFICMPDVLTWNLVFMFVNTCHLAYLGYQIIPSRFSKTCEDLYLKTFKPLKVTRKQFQKIAEFGNILVLAKGAVYAKEGNSRCGQKLSMLLKGR